jgi:hypothetical protein
MDNSEKKISEVFFRIAGVSAIVLVCVPLTSLILSVLIKIDWLFIGIVSVLAAVLAAAGIVICLGIGGIFALMFEE